tara:strand:+ start:1366 stop:1860 length:495 start_codon:yes stop_codon:yes gene_type:complete
MKKLICIIIVSNLILISCNSVRESAGVSRKNIDEYAVVENPPLVIPPDFNLIPPDQIKSKNIDDTEKELAKEILFGLDEEEIESNDDNSLIIEIINETKANSVSNDIRTSIDQDFSGIKSSIDDETKFKNEEELNDAIQDTKKRNIDEVNSEKKEKKKKRFFFF